MTGARAVYWSLMLQAPVAGVAADAHGQPGGGAAAAMLSMASNASSFMVLDSGANVHVFRTCSGLVADHPVHAPSVATVTGANTGAPSAIVGMCTNLP